MSDQHTSERLLIYASEQYLLPADKVESRRLDAQHRFITTLFEGKLSTAPTNLTTGDRVLESAAGTGIWALEFFEENRADGVILDIECIDISSAQFPANHPPELHFSIHSIVNLPNPNWSDIFAYAHQRLLLFAMNESLWRLAVSELFRVIRPGGWVELVEIDLDLDGWSVLGPDTARLMSLGTALFDAKGVIGDLSVYAPGTLKDAGFVEVRCEPRRVLIGGEAIHVHEFPTALTYSSELWREVWMGMKGPVVEAGGYGIIENVEEYEALVEASARECRFASKQQYVNFHTIMAQKPEM
ncbi:hypothetical protein F5880DRAFT_1486967 [Lentinula raphanica]|nr:hypothetical protein F5880DRAFT_1486967 [Lentinula raphanica]